MKRDNYDRDLNGEFRDYFGDYYLEQIDNIFFITDMYNERFTVYTFNNVIHSCSCSEYENELNNIDSNCKCEHILCIDEFINVMYRDVV